MRGARRAFGDIGNSQVDGDNPFPFKQPVAGATSKILGITSSRSTTNTISQQQSVCDMATKPKLGVKSHRTVGHAAGSSIAQAFREPTLLATKASGRTRGNTTLWTKPSNVSKNGDTSGLVTVRQSVITKQENVTIVATQPAIEQTFVVKRDKEEVAGPAPQVVGKKLARPADILTETAYITETDVESVAAAFSQQRLDLPEDIDAKDSHNPILCTEYINDIMAYMFALEKKYPIRNRYLDGRHINSRMRAVLLDWLIEVHDQYKFTAETLFLCGKLMDRYLQADHLITRQDLQLVGVTSLYLASKYEEVYTPTMHDFVVISDNAFTVHNIRQMEMRMLNAINFDLSPPQPCFFLRRFSKAAFADAKLHALAKYLMELSLIDYNVSDLFPSEVASASLALALMILDKKPLTAVWSKTLEHYSKYSVEALRPNVLKLAQVLGRVHQDDNKLQAVRKKYSRAKPYLKISKSEDLNVAAWKERIMSELESTQKQQFGA